MKRHSWRDWIWTGIVGLTILGLEGARQQGVSVPVPFLILFVLSILSTIRGTRVGLASMALTVLYILYARIQGFGPPGLTGSWAGTILGSLTLLGLALFLGRLQERYRSLIAQLKAQEQREEEARIFLEELLTRSPVIAFRREGPEQRLTFITENVREILGHDPEELLNEPQERALERVHPEDRASLLQAMGEAQRQGQARVLYRSRHRDGSYRWLYGVAQVEPGPEGPVVLGYLLDLTPQKEMEAWFQALLEAIPSGILVTDEAGRIVLANAQAQRLTGYGWEELEGQPVEILLPEDLAERHRELRQSYYANPVPREMGKGRPLHLRRRDGTLLPVEIGLSPVWRKGQLHVLAIVQDISHRRRMEAELERQRQQLLETLTIARAYTWSVPIDEEGPRWTEIEFIGPVEEVTGYSPAAFQALIAQAFQEQEGAWLHPADLENLEALLHRLPAEGDQTEVSFRIRHPEGGWRWLHVTLRRQGDRFIGFTQDLTALTEERIRAAAAREASEAKSRFLSRTSHELRTPLNSILGFAQLLEMEPLSPKQQEYVRHILKAGRHLLELINEILEISRAEAGRLPLSPEPIQVQEAFQEALSLIAPLARKRGIELLPEPVAEDLYLWADRQRLHQILLNLLANAVKYNRPGGKVWLRAQMKGEGRVRIEVEDTGVGIDRERLNRIFEPFERMEGEEEGEGTGLGLTLARRFVEAMEGKIGVESQPGRGSLFWFELPQAERPGPRPRQPGTPRPLEPDAPRTGRPVTVLYIEDNPANLRLMERLLERRPNTRLIAAVQGQMGLDLAREHRPDLILLDLHLPDLPGEEVLAQLKRDPRTQSIPVLVLSASASPRRERRLLAMGAYAYLTKPLDLQQFWTVLDQALGEGEERER